MMQYDEILPEDLDGNGNMSVTVVDHSVLREAEANNVALDELEKFSHKEEKKISKPTEENETWQNLDIRLSDVINSFIETSEQPAFLVRDDNLVYVNEAGLAILGFSTDKEVLGVRFLNFVFQEDWSKLAENIGEMLTNGKTVKFNLKNQNGKLREVSFQAVYLPEIEHFSFILVGKTPKKVSKPTINNLYDEITGLPSFFLFEDRVLVAMSAERAKTNVADKRMLAVVAININ
ncbi:MAG: PAS domain S-box protein, partial [Alphaproteobacteria bacterium]|nr:PAS domain S-box protein [Alphaproteobacteria bacterium]